MKFQSKISYLININKYYLLFLVFCLIGCLYQVYQVTDVYLAYRTKVDVSFESKSQFKVPLTTFCKTRFALMRNESLRNPLLIKSFDSSTPASIDNQTFGIEDVFQLCRYYNDKGTYVIGDCKLLIQDVKVQIEKTVNYWYICFNIKHPQFASNKRRKEKLIYEFWLYHHFRSEFDLFFTSDNEIPNGDSANKLS